MEYLVISFGLGVAISFGVVLLAMVLRAAILNYRSPSGFTIADPTQLTEEAPSDQHFDSAEPIRGYDTPELWRDDTMTRHGRVHE